MTIKRIAACLIGLVACGIAVAQVRPEPGGGDPRLQSIDYHADQVVLLEATPGYQLSVELAPDEQIQSVALGDSSAWQVTANKAGNQLFLKPLQTGAETNMTVITNVRRYAFDLSTAGQSGATPYTVRFRYPAAAKAVPLSPAAAIAQATGRYRLHGARILRPALISDDGLHTYIDWPAEAALPAVYSLDAAGRETLANGNMRDGIYVIDSVEQHLVFRIDKQIARADRMRDRKEAP